MKPIPKPGRVYLPFALLFVLSILFVNINKYRKGHLTLDLAYYANVLWNTDFYSRFLYSDICLDLFGGSSFLNDHFSPTFFLLVPLYRLFESPLLLVVVQAMVPAVTGFFILKIGKACQANNNSFLFLSIVYLFHPSNVAATADFIYGFHLDCLAPLFAVLVFYFYLKDRPGLFVCALTLLLGLKESIPLTGMLLGALLLFKRKKYGVWALGLSALFIAAGLFVYPLMSWGHIGTRHSGLIQQLADPSFLSNLTGMKQWLLMFLLAPCVFAPQILWLSLPDFMIYTLAGSADPFLWRAFFIYSIFTVASAAGLHTICTATREKSRRLALITIYAVFSISMVAGCGYLFKQISYAQGYPYLHSADSVAVIQKEIPGGACLITTSDLFVTFANRRHLTYSAERAQYFLINERLSRPPLDPFLRGNDKELLGKLEELKADNKVERIRSVADELTLYRRDPEPQGSRIQGPRGSREKQ